MREFVLILLAAIGSAILGAGFGWLIGHRAPEFILVLAQPYPVTSPDSVATALGAIAGLGLGALAMSVGVLASALRSRGAK